VSLVFGAARPWDASQPTRIEVDPRAIGLPWSRAAASVRAALSFVWQVFHQRQIAV